MMLMRELPFPRRIGVKNKKRITLLENLYLDIGIHVPRGTTITIWQTTNFGWVKLDNPINGRSLFSN